MLMHLPADSPILCTWANSYGAHVVPKQIFHLPPTSAQLLAQPATLPVCLHSPLLFSPVLPHSDTPANSWNPFIFMMCLSSGGLDFLRACALP